MRAENKPKQRKIKTMNKDNIKISEKNIGGTVRALQVYCPTHEEWLEAIGAERLAARFNQGLIAHDLATGLKAAYAEETEKTRESVKLERAELRKLVENPETVFDLREFIAGERKAAEDKAAAAREEGRKQAEETMLRSVAAMLGCTVEEAREQLAQAAAGK